LHRQPKRGNFNLATMSLPLTGFYRPQTLAQLMEELQEHIPYDETREADRPPLRLRRDEQRTQKMASEG
jgi:hypothetical protein